MKKVLCKILISTSILMMGVFMPVIKSSANASIEGIPRSALVDSIYEVLEDYEGDEDFYSINLTDGLDYNVSLDSYGFNGNNPIYNNGGPWKYKEYASSAHETFLDSFMVKEGSVKGITTSDSIYNLEDGGTARVRFYNALFARRDDTEKSGMDAIPFNPQESLLYLYTWYADNNTIDKRYEYDVYYDKSTGDFVYIEYYVNDEEGNNYNKEAFVCEYRLKILLMPNRYNSAGAVDKLMDEFVKMLGEDSNILDAISLLSKGDASSLNKELVTLANVLNNMYSVDINDSSSVLNIHFDAFPTRNDTVKTQPDGTGYDLKVWFPTADSETVVTSTSTNMKISFNLEDMSMSSGFLDTTGTHEGNTSSYENLLITLVQNLQTTGDSDSASKDLSAALGENPNESKCRFLTDILYCYRDMLNDMIKEQQINQDVAVGDKLVNIDRNSTPFEVLNEILRLSIQCVDGDVSIPERLSYNDDSSVVSVCADNWNRKKQTTDISLYELYTSLPNQYQRSVLVNTYKDKLRALGMFSTDGSVSGNPAIIDNFAELGFPTDMGMTADGLNLGLNQITESTRQLVIDYNDSGLYGTGSAIIVARSANTLAHYAITTSLFSKFDSDADYTNLSTESNMFTVYDADLDGLIQEQWLYESNEADIAQQNYFATMPNKIGLFKEDQEGFRTLCYTEGGWSRFRAMLFNVEYAFNIYAYSAFGESVGSNPLDIAQELVGGTAKIEEGIESIKDLKSADSTTVAEANLSKYSETELAILRSVIELHDMCEFLQIEQGDWSEIIDLYLQLYEENESLFNALRNNPYLYDTNAAAEVSVKEPLGMFFNLEKGEMTDEWSKGFAMSALYVPMETNLYDASSIAFLNDADWVSSFYYKYAFYRKALYINTDNSAIVNSVVSSSESSSTRVATLSDLLNYECDIVLYVDDNFYNADLIGSVIDKIDYTAIEHSSTNAEGDVSWAAGVSGAFGDLSELTTNNVLKNDDISYYSTTVIDNITKLGVEEDTSNSKERRFNEYILTADEIVGTTDKPSVILADEYSVRQPYGVVSAIYRSPELYNAVLTSIVTDNAIFKSSRGILDVPGASMTEWRSIYNYCMLSNLADLMKNNATTTLDLNAPLFTDLFGNIVTESGIVVIPAASNATLCGINWTPYTVGFSEYYKQGNRLVDNEYPSDVYSWLIGSDYENTAGGTQVDYSTDGSSKYPAGGYFEIGENSELILASKSLTSGNVSGIVSFDVVNKNSDIIKQLFYNQAYNVVATDIYSNKMVNLVVETLRGAPLENINYAKEDLEVTSKVTATEVFAASKLEEFIEFIGIASNVSKGGNGVVTMPNLAFVSGIEYVVLYAFKIMFAFMAVIFVFQLYMDSVKNNLGIKSVSKFVGTCLLTIIALTTVPSLCTWSYYNANKVLLSDEVSKILMLNYCKNFDGAEIGMQEVTTPETNTELYLKVSDVKIDWWEILDEILFTNTYKTVSQLYTDQSSDNPMAHAEDIVVKGDGLYAPVNEIFESTKINYSPTTNIISNVMLTYGKPTTVQNAAVSFTSPYYVFLDQLISNVNEYNISRDVEAYSWSIGSNGHIMTYDLVNPYLMSSEFLEEGLDILGLYRTLDTTYSIPTYAYTMTNEDRERIRLSSWYPVDGFSEEVILEKIDELYDYARHYIAANASSIGSMPDEVFLKTFALQLAVKYNQLFDVPYGRSIEIINIDTRDLLRFTVADASEVYKNFAFTYPRFVFEQSGVLGVTLSAVLVLVVAISNAIKPLSLLIIIGLMITNVLFRKLLFKKESKCIEGYIIACGLLITVNYVYSLALKITFVVPNVGAPTALSLIIAILVQIIYTSALVFIISLEVKDWKNSGFNEFANAGAFFANMAGSYDRFVRDKFISRRNQSYVNSSVTNVNNDSQVNQDPSLEDMLARDNERQERGNRI